MKILSIIVVSVLSFNPLSEQLVPDNVMDTCYARQCETFTGTDGFEYKRCTEWEEVDCAHIIPARISASING